MSVYAGLKQSRDIYQGTQPVLEVYEGLTKIYERPTSYRMYKTNSQKGDGSSYIHLTSMSADSSYPKTQVVSSGIEIPQHCPPFTATVFAEVYRSGGTAPKCTTSIRKNGVTIATGSEASGTSSASVVTPLVPGDVLTIYWRGNGSFWTYPSATDNSYMLVTPQGY